MPSVLQNILSFTGLTVGVPTALPHGLNLNGRGIVPKTADANSAGYTITADDTNVTVTRGASASADVDIRVEYWHSIIDAEPLPNGIATSMFPFVMQGGGTGGGGGGITNLSAGTTLATGPSISFANGGNVTFGLSGNTITASVNTVGGTATGVGLSAGTESAGTGAVVFANSNNITFGMSLSSQVTASFSASVQPNPAISAAGASASNGTIIFSNSNGVSFGMNGSTVTASVSSAPAETPFGVSAGTQSVSTGTLIFSASNGLAFGMSGSSRITGSYSTLSFDNAGGNVTFGIVGSTITASAPVGTGAGAGIAFAAGTQTATTATVVLSNSSGVVFGMANSSVVTGRVASVLGTNGENVTVRGSGAPVLIENVNSNVSVLAGSDMALTAAGSLSVFGGAAIMSAGNATVQAGNNLTLSAANTLRAIGAAAGYVLLGASNNSIGFFGANGGARSTVTGTGATALSNLFGALDAYGLISSNVGALTFGGAAPAVAASGGTITNGTASFSNSNGVFFGVNGSTVTARVATVSGTANQSVSIIASNAQLLISNASGHVDITAGGGFAADVAGAINFGADAFNVNATIGAISMSAKSTFLASASGNMSLRAGGIAVLSATGNSAIVYGSGVSISAANGNTIHLGAPNGEVNMGANTINIGNGGGLAFVSALTGILGAASGSNVGFFGSSGGTKRVITGGSTALTAAQGSIISSILSALHAYGLISSNFT